MTKVRLILMSTLAGCALLAAGCKSLAGSACLKPPPEAEIKSQPPLRIPVGLDPLNTSSALKVPPLESAAVQPSPARCLEDPPLIQPLPDPVATEKAQKRQARKRSREARDAKPPGPRFNGS
jgi:hypothetical protein